MVKKRIWLFVLAAAVLLAAVLVGLSILLSKEGEGVYKGAKLVLQVQDAFLRMPGKVA